MADETAQQATADRIVEGLIAPILDLSEQIVGELQDLENAAADSNRAVGDLASVIEERQHRIVELEATVADYNATKERLGVAEAKLRNIERLAEEIGMDRDRLGVKVTEGNSKLEEMQRMINDQEALIMELRKAAQEVPQLKADIDFHLAQNAMLRKDLNTMDLRLVDAEQRRERLEDLLRRLAPTLQTAAYEFLQEAPETSGESLHAARHPSGRKGAAEIGAHGKKRAAETQK
ncbi:MULTISPECIES: hypothetical protein [Sphingobium]|uniref:DNA repair exonuclease SbcCD ATPase subunit n=1 Tax=Sphingobium lignivorans TaxID=2735886 RepID=A0ABR6NL80_9SPHN|nr:MULTISPECIES: hypothetical protein [Sphingobium]MBB5986934.1 DNA repair exonuclease SbcCD ATPase subunit [Sphingobium lignivorans]BAK67567.1 hypothetical protein SLG_28920 [Sphingobium sp. SYK-6]